jgi:hypothetical protein
MRNTAGVTGGKPIAVLLQSISSAINPLIAFNNIHGGMREVLFYFVPDTTRDFIIIIILETKPSCDWIPLFGIHSFM